MSISSKLSLMLEHLIDGSLEFGKDLIFAIIVYFIGRYVIKFLMRLMEKIMLRRKLDETLRSFVSNLVKVILQVTLFVFIITILGVRGSSIMALVASAGLGIGLALSGTLQNFANGVLLLLFKPYRVGDYIETQGIGGTVKAIQIFHTILITSDNKTIYIPNGTMSSSLMTNFNQQKTRRIEWNIGIEYGESFDKVRQTILEVIGTEQRILNSPEPLIELNQLADSQVVVIVRVWVKVDNYWDVYFATNKKIYETFNQKGINFPFPQLTIHQE